MEKEIKQEILSNPHAPQGRKSPTNLVGNRKFHLFGKANNCISGTKQIIVSFLKIS
jgi:hypothetical protein